MTPVRIKRLHPDAELPAYATDGSGAFDLRAVGGPPQVLSTAVPLAVVRTGLAFEVPQGHVMLLFSRSGHGFNHSVRLGNCVGVIDADYRGEVMASLRHDGDGKPLVIRAGDRVAQAMILPVERVTFEVVDELSSTERGAGGFGSTGS